MTEAKGNTAVQQHGDHDRVAMLSLRADGSPDQHDPEIIGDREFAEAATREQFRQQAVSATDQQVRADQDAAGVTGDGTPAQVDDPAIAELKDAHQSAADAAEKAADRTVDELFGKYDPASTVAEPKKTSGSTAGKATGGGQQ